MTPNEALEAYQWVNERWPRTPWKASEVQALAADTKSVDSSDVWDALMRLHHRGLEFPPSVSQVVALARELSHANARLRGPRSLPTPAGWGFTFERWREAHGFASREEAVEAYAAGDRRCTGDHRCGVCRQVAEGDRGNG